MKLYIINVHSKKNKTKSKLKHHYLMSKTVF